MVLKELAVNDRPREKLLELGVEHLSESELLAIIIGSGTADLNALLISQRILHKYSNDVKKLNNLSVKDFTKFKGIGTVKAITIKAALEFGKRQSLKEPKEETKISCSKDAYNYMKGKMENLVHEEFWIILLNRANVVLRHIRISSGGITSTVVDPKIIFRHAIESAATSIILVHNHPSGNLNPSQEDLALTRKISSAAKLFDISIFDHIIIAQKGYYSFADSGIQKLF